MYYSQIFPNPLCPRIGKTVWISWSKSPQWPKKWLKRFHTVTDINMGTLLTHSLRAERTNVG